MKKLVSVLLVIALVAGLSIAAFAANQASISVTSVETNPGETVTLTVAIDANPGIAALCVGVEYDKAALTLNSMTNVGMDGGAWTIGTNALWDDAKDSTFTGAILTLEFAVSADAEAGKTYPVTLSVESNNLDEEDVVFAVTAGAVVIAKAEEPTEPEVTEPEVTEPEVTEPEVTEPEVTEPEVTEPEVTEPEVTEPEVTEPEVTEPEVTEPEVTEPDVTEPEIDDEPDTGDVTSVIACAVVALASIAGTGITVLKRKK